MLNLLEVITRGCRQAELVADKVVEHSPGIPPDGTVCLIRDDEIEVGRGEEALILVVEEQRLDGGDDNFSTTPVVAVLLIDDGLVVVGEGLSERLQCLILKLKAIHKEENPARIPCPKEELDEGG